MWTIRPLQGKYYGTIVENKKTGDQIIVCLSMRINKYRASDREYEEGWNEEWGYDHVELQHSYEAALKIMKALNENYPST
jgi:hypothetical protein